jgi:hypothetical protein
LVNGVDRYRDRQDRRQDDHHQDHQDLHQDDRHRDHLDHQSRHQDDQHQDHRADLVRRLDDQHLDRQDDRHRDHQDHQVHVCPGQMDALVHQYLQDRDQEHLQEYGRCVHQRLDHLDDHPLVDDRRQELHLDDQEEEELDDRYLEVAELDDHLDLSAVAAEDAEQQAL